MSEEFARVLVENLNRKIRFAKSESCKQALKDYRNAIIESMQKMGHDIGYDILK